MSVKYILSQAGVKMGLNPNDINQRQVLLRFLNEAAPELYEQADPEGSLLEEIYQVNGDQQIALPPHVGPLRAMREYSTHIPWHINKMRPRFNQFNWKDRWRNWRLKGLSPISYPLVNQAPLTVSVEAVESPAIAITITGETTSASQVSETVTLSATSVITVNNFVEILSIKKDRVNNYDVHVKDADDNVLAQIPNNELTIRYRIVDVSLYPWSNTDLTQNSHFMEVLFKKALPYLSDDGDEFPAPDCDNILVNKMLQLWAEEQGKTDAAVAYDSKATRGLARKKEEANRGAEEEASLVENPHDTLSPRNRSSGPGRYVGQVWY